MDRAVAMLIPSSRRPPPESVESVRLRLLVAAGLVGFVVCLAFAGERVAGGETVAARVATVLVSAILFLGSPCLVRVTGTSRLGSLVLIGSVCVVIATDGFLYGGLGAPSFAALLVLPVLGSLLLGTHFAWVAAGVGTVIVALFFALSTVDIAFPPLPPPSTWTLMHAVALTGLLWFLAALATVYERRRISNEAALRVSEQRYARAFHATNAGMVIADPTSAFADVSPRLREFLALLTV